MAEILVKTLTRHRDSKSALYMTDWTAGDVIEIKPDGYYTGNRWGGAKRMGIVLCVDADLPEEYSKKVHYEPTPIYENGELIDPCNYSKMLGRSELIVDLTTILTDQELFDCFNHDVMVSPKHVKKSYLDLLVNRASRTELHAYDRQGSFTTGTIDVGPNGHSDANTWAEAESNIANLTGDLTFNCDEAYQDTTPVTVAGFSLNGHTLTFSCSDSGKHSGYDNGSANHMLHKCATGGSHCWTLDVVCILDGFVVWQNSNGSSDECVRTADGGTGSTIKNSILHTGLLAADQDGIYAGDWDVVINVENTIIYSARRAGVNMQSYSTSNGRTQVLNAKGVVVVHTGTHDAETEAGFHGRTEHSGDSLTMNLFNCMSFDSGNANCYTKKAEAGSQTWNIDNCIDDDNSIAGVVTNGAGNLASRTLADTDQGSGNYVIVNETALGSEDFRLIDLGNAKNNAQDAHAVATGPNSGLAMPSADLVGTSRPQNTNYDIGAFEIAGEATVYDETGKALNVTADINLSDCQTFKEALAEAIAASIAGTELQAYRNTLAQTIAAGIAGSDIQVYIDTLVETVASVVAGVDQQNYIDALSQVIDATLTGMDLQAYQEALAENIGTDMSLSDRQTYNNTLSQVIGAAVVGTERQAYIDALSQSIAAQVAGTDTIGYLEILSETIAAAVVGDDMQTYREDLDEMIGADIAVTDRQAYKDILTQIITATLAGTDRQTYIEALAVAIAAQITGSDVIHYLEALSETIGAAITVTDVQIYRNMLAVGVAADISSYDIQCYIEELSTVLGAVVTVTDAIPYRVLCTIDPTIESITPKRTMTSTTPVRLVISITPEREVDIL